MAEWRSTSRRAELKKNAIVVLFLKNLAINILRHAVQGVGKKTHIKNADAQEKQSGGSLLLINIKEYSFFQLTGYT